MIDIFIFFIQATMKHDIELPSNIPELLLEKHANYLISYGTNKDEYVKIYFNLFCCIYIHIKLYIFLFMPFCKDILNILNVYRLQ